MMMYLISAIAALTGFLFGFDEGIMSGVLSQIKQDFSLDNHQTGFMMGLLPFGALLSSVMTGRICDWIGRRNVLRLVPILFAIAILLIIGTLSYKALCFARFLLGISIGMSVVVSPLYIAETTPSEVRGKLVICFQLAITIGILISYVLNLLNASYDIGFSWRWMFGVGLIPAAVLFFGALLLPETPRWLCAKGRRDQAEVVLRMLYESQLSSYSKTRTEKELNEIEEAIHQAKSKKSVWKLLVTKKIYPCLILGIMLFFFQQLSGINVIIYYAPTVFKKLQFGSESATLLATAGVGTLNVIMTVVAMRWVEKIGRRPLLLLGFLGTTASLLVIAIISYFNLDQFSWLSAICVFLYIAFFAVSLGPLPWVMMPEIFPLNVRGQGASFSAASNWLFNTLVVASFPIMLHSIGIGPTFACYAAACILGYFFSLRYVPETKNLSLEEIEAHIRSGRPFRTLGNVK